MQLFFYGTLFSLYSLWNNQYSIAGFAAFYWVIDGVNEQVINLMH